MILDRNDSSGSEVSAAGGTPIHLGRRGYKLRGPITPNDTRNLAQLRRNETNDMPRRSRSSADDEDTKVVRSRMRSMTTTQEETAEDNNNDKAPKSPIRKSRASRSSRIGSRNDTTTTTNANAHGTSTTTKPKFPANPPRRGYKVEEPIRPNDSRSLAQLRRNKTKDMPQRRGRRSNPTTTTRAPPSR